MNLQFRHAAPGDVEEAIPLIYDSGAPFNDYRYAVGRRTPIDFLRVAFVAGWGKLSYSSHVAAVLDGHVVGIVTSFDRTECKSGTWERIWPIVRFYGPLRCWTVLRRLVQLRGLWSSPQKDDLSIEHLGVRDDMRGRGIGTALLTDQIEMARSKGLRRCILDVAVTNPRAQIFYERLGFQVVGETKSHITSSTVKVPDVRHMEMLL